MRELINLLLEALLRLWGNLIGVYVLRNFLLKKWQFRLGGVKVRGHAGYGSWESNDSGMLLHLRCRNERRGKLR